MALTEKDLQAIGDLIAEKIKAEVPPLIRAEIKGLPTVEDTDQLMGELQAIRQEQTMSANRLRDHEDRITSLENIHPGGEHKA